MLSENNAAHGFALTACVVAADNTIIVVVLTSTDRSQQHANQRRNPWVACLRAVWSQPQTD